LPGFLVAAGFFSAAFVWLATRRGHTGPGIALAALALLAAYICLPFSAGGATYLDSRVSLMLALVLAAGFQPPAMSMWQRGVSRRCWRRP
jgi:hypothetical protein